MKSIRKLTLAAVAALAALAVAAPAASAGWQIQTAAGAPYTGPITATIAVGSFTWGDFSWAAVHNCTSSTLSGSVTNAGPATPQATITSAGWSSCDYNGGAGPTPVFSAKNAPWSVTVTTDTVGQPKLSIASPQLYAAWNCAPPNSNAYSGTSLQGRLSNHVSDGLRLSFNSALAAVGHNNLFQATHLCSYVQWEYRAIGTYRIVGSGGAKLQIVQIP
jgi:hypothetical protein